ncbi:hypothetical protein [Paenibacillus sp. IHBB 10380]|uniref:hypothetical protein n=1 Tax=Paenibacillus sp. IHBB 10380 TaxID=1566358 RepID=UPI0005CFE90D|nr:hypothetical protein [Paenibacillus sp. IHBB 10380]AJS59237.1 hypothetical protein UB51_13040 [Paenibacillus sp. IHBB 10380]
MGMSTSFNSNGESIDVGITPKNHYSPAIVSFRTFTDSVQLHLTDEQIAEAAYVFNQYLDGIRYPETPDQQQILNAEINQAIEEGIA